MQVCYCQLTGVTEIPFTLISKKYKNGIKIDTLRYQYKIDTLFGKYNGKIEIKKGDKIFIKGKLKNNQKFGKWKYYDTISNKPFLTREYKNDYEFNTLKTKIGFPKKNYHLEKNIKSKVVTHPNVEVNDIIYTFYYFSYIPNSKSNNYIFEKDALWLKLKKLINSIEKIHLYKDSGFREELVKSEYQKFIKNNQIKIIGYKISESYYFDKTFESSQTRLISICPIAQIDNKNKDLFWLFYPEIRENLANQQLIINNELTSFEDMFFFDNYEKYIYYRDSVDVLENEIKIDYENLQQSLINKSVDIFIFTNVLDYKSFMLNKN